MSDWFYKAALGGAIQVAGVLVSSGPTLLVGLLIAAVLRFYLGVSGTKRLFGGDSLRSLPQSWAVGMLLPVCSIGVLPILIEMRRSRIKPGAMSAFALSAPLFNPLSLLYGLTLSRPYVILMFAFGSLLVVTAVGFVWDAFSLDKQETQQDSPRSVLIGVKRLFAIQIYLARQLMGPVGAWAVVAALGMFLLAAVLPWGALGHSVSRDDWWAPVRMAFVATPAYATPMLAMSQLGMMFQHANSPGAAFILLVVGAGVNFATLGWLGRQFGIRAVVVWFACLMTVVVGIAYAVNVPLIPPGVEPSDHTHAFDVYTNPVHHIDSGKLSIEKFQKNIGIPEQITIILLGVGLLLGAVVRVIGLDPERWSQPSETQPSETRPLEPNQIGRIDRIISPQTVGATLLAGLVAISIVMCYAYYPSPEECLKEIRFIRGDTLSASLSGDNEHAKFWIPRWDEWSRRLEVGTYIRHGNLTPYQRMQGFLIRKKLDLLEHELEHDHADPQVMRDLVTEIMATDSRWVKAYSES